MTLAARTAGVAAGVIIARWATLELRALRHRWREQFYDAATQGYYSGFLAGEEAYHDGRRCPPLVDDPTGDAGLRTAAVSLRPSRRRQACAASWSLGRSVGRHAGWRQALVVDESEEARPCDDIDLVAVEQGLEALRAWANGRGA